MCRCGTNLFLFISSPVGLKQEKPGLREGQRTGWVVDNNPPDFNPFLHAVLALTLGSSKFFPNLRILHDDFYPG